VDHLTFEGAVGDFEKKYHVRKHVRVPELVHTHSHWQKKMHTFSEQKKKLLHRQNNIMDKFPVHERKKN